MFIVKKRRYYNNEFKREAVQAFPGKGHLKFQDEEIRVLTRGLERVRRERDITERRRTEQSLTQSEERFRTNVNGARDLIFIKDGSCKYQFVNTAMERLFGVPALELLGKTDEELFGKDAGKYIGEVDRHVLQGGVVEEEHARYVQGVLAIFHVIKVPIMDTAGGIVGICGIARDITERMCSEKMLRQTRSELVRRVKPCTSELAAGDEQLELQSGECNWAKEALREREDELNILGNRLKEVNTGFKVLLKQREEDKRELEEKILLNVKNLLMPYIEEVKKRHLDSHQMACVSILESNIKDIISPFIRSLSSKLLNLTPMEIRIASLIRSGKTTKEIARLLHLADNTIISHRYKLRSKLGLKNKKTNLVSYLQSMD